MPVREEMELFTQWVSGEHLGAWHSQTQHYKRYMYLVMSPNNTYYKSHTTFFIARMHTSHVLKQRMIFPEICGHNLAEVLPVYYIAITIL